MEKSTTEPAPAWGKPQAIGRTPWPAGSWVDVVVVGAGLTGCSAALHLASARPELSVLLVDAGPVGSGASGRGTGLLGPRLGPPIDVARRRDGDDVARSRYRRSEAAVRRVLDLADRFAPEALGPVQGQLVVGITAAERRKVLDRARAYADLGLDVALVEAGDRAQPAGAAAPALRYPVAAGVDPARLTRGLARGAASLGVTLVELTPVRALQPSGPGRTAVLTDAGVVQTGAVVLALDVASPGLAGAGPGHNQLGLQVSATMTEPLPTDLLARLGGPGAPHVLSVAGLGAYRRITPDGRLVIGGGPTTLTTAGPRTRVQTEHAAWRWHRRWLAAVDPELAEVDVASRWSGRISLTRSGLPEVSRCQLGAEVWSAGGWNGHGLAATVEVGAWLADHVLAHTEPPRTNWFTVADRWWLAAAPAAPVARLALGAALPRPPRHRNRSIKRGVSTRSYV